jgi:hypothetical protein
MGDKDSKIGKVDSASRSRAVKETEALGGVEQTKRVEKVKGVQQTASVSKVGQVVSKAEHAQLMRMVEEEADSMFGSSMSEDRKRLLKSAVKMALDSGLIIAEEEDED